MKKMVFWVWDILTSNMKLLEEFKRLKRSFVLFPGIPDLSGTFISEACLGFHFFFGQLNENRVEYAQTCWVLQCVRLPFDLGSVLARSAIFHTGF